MGDLGATPVHASPDGDSRFSLSHLAGQRPQNQGRGNCLATYQLGLPWIVMAQGFGDMDV